ncbi:DUF3309 family protein [Salinarimonas rosea]|uniref:DUF3309 family protein n=1 Tax=Salinarimonas rosea TaxID=552063 RepID=UPI000428327F|nr:DUF3309 family protein [Salinarimonas rosea]
MYGFWILLLLLVVLLAVVPAWPYSRGWGYTPAGTLLGVVILFFVFVWLGWIVFAWPWAAAY